MRVVVPALHPLSLCIQLTPSDLLRGSVGERDSNYVNIAWPLIYVAQSKSARCFTRPKYGSFQCLTAGGWAMDKKPCPKNSTSEHPA